MPPGPLDKYQLRETKRRLLQGLGGSQQNLLGPWICAHLSPLRRDPFCGEHKLGTPSHQPLSILTLSLPLYLGGVSPAGVTPFPEVLLT